MITRTNGWCSANHKKRKRAVFLVDGRSCCRNCSHQHRSDADKKLLKHLVHEYRVGVRKATSKRRKSVGNINKRTALVSQRVPALRRRSTAAEKVFLCKLKETKILFKFQRAFIKKGGFVIVDFYIPRLKLAIEVDGGYHNTPEQQGKDKWKERYLMDNYGIRTVRFTNEQAQEMGVDAIKACL